MAETRFQKKMTEKKSCTKPSQTETGVKEGHLSLKSKAARAKNIRVGHGALAKWRVEKLWSFDKKYLP